MPTVDLNADLGEGLPAALDDALLDIVTSANVACGGHAGDHQSMRRTLLSASSRGVAVGAHPSYRDRAGFGRRALDVPPEVLRADVLIQLDALLAVASEVGVVVGYVKPHGALYNAIVHDEAQAEAVVDAIGAAFPGGTVLGLPGSAFLRLATQAGLRPVTEGFVDRAYTPQGTLVPRSEPGAVLLDPDAVTTQAARLALSGLVDSLCVHGDTPGTVALASAVREALVDAGVTIAPFAS